MPALHPSGSGSPAERFDERDQQGLAIGELPGRLPGSLRGPLRGCKNRRSPATIWNAPPEGRNETGLKDASPRIEVASSLMVVGVELGPGLSRVRTILSRRHLDLSLPRSTVRSSGATATSRFTAAGMSEQAPDPKPS